ncbi:melanocortin receptor 3 [Nematostella vectensis]|uniref:melanocortin receptor 3 n=1 Tax=Nematostella vectensis TaxID=45351 RepID=UPI0020776F3E|nr:melanocortin receptor 3 [Nematostella vectensis]
MSHRTNHSQGSCFFAPPFITNVTPPVYITNIVSVVLNLIFSVLAVTENAVVIFVISKSRHLRSSPSNILLCSLAISDLVIGSVCQTFYVVYKVSELYEWPGVYCVARLVAVSFGWVCAGVSLMTISSIIVDRYLALLLHMRYNALITTSKVYRLVLVYWIACAGIVSLRFMPEVEKSWILLPLVLLAGFLLVTLVAYFRMFRMVRRIHSDVLDARSSRRDLPNSTSLSRYKCLAATMFYVLLLFLGCYVPFLVIMATEAVLGYTVEVMIAYDYAVTIVFVSSSINPMVYCFRIREIRQAVINTLPKRFRPGRAVDKDMAWITTFSKQPINISVIRN